MSGHTIIDNRYGHSGLTILRSKSNGVVSLLGNSILRIQALTFFEGSTACNFLVWCTNQETAFQLYPSWSIGHSKTISRFDSKLIVDRLTCGILGAYSNTGLSNIVAQLIINFEFISFSRTLNLSNSHFLTAHLQVQLSYAHILAGIIVSNSYLDCLLTSSTIEHETRLYSSLRLFLILILSLYLRDLTPDLIRRKTPVLVGIERKLFHIASSTCDSLYLWKYRIYGIVVAGTSGEQGH
ncbi:unknown [Prevotella sp. CAG:604]|nr:unknown [Prevotella sp. CAG:604]